MISISVIITTKNRPFFLKRAIKSVNSNTVLPNEIIVVNDGGEELESSDFDSGVKINIINNASSLGANKARNQGVEASSGELIFFLDDDDAYTINSIESRLDVFNNSSAGLVYTGRTIVYSDDLDSEVRYSKPTLSGLLFKKLLFKGNVIGSTSGVAVKRTVFLKAGMFDVNLGALQDYDLWLRIAKLCEVRHDNACNIYYTIHSNNSQISGNYKKYLDASTYLLGKYREDIVLNKAFNHFIAARYLRVSMAAARTLPSIRLKYALLSFVKKPSLKALFFALPYSFTSKFIKFS